MTTPQSQHAKQRVPRLVAAAETDIPSAYFIPNRKMSGGTSYVLGGDLHHGLTKVRQINSVPVFIFPFPDNHGVLLQDPVYPGLPDRAQPSTVSAIAIINDIIAHRLAMRGAAGVLTLPSVMTHLAAQDAIGVATAVAIANYDSLVEINTSNLASFLLANTAMKKARIAATIARLPGRVRARNRTLIFRPGGRLLEHANDPYSGMLAYFDYEFCRFGRHVEERTKNLIYMPMNPDKFRITDEFAPDGYHAFWENSCPFRRDAVPTVDAQFAISHHLQYGCVFSKSKPLRILGYFSDMIVFQDAVLVF